MLKFTFLSKDDYFKDFKNYLDKNEYNYYLSESDDKGYNEYIFNIEDVDAKLITFIEYMKTYI
jgi:hypothetical protein